MWRWRCSSSGGAYKFRQVRASAKERSWWGGNEVTHCQNLKSKFKEKTTAFQMRSLPFDGAKAPQGTSYAVNFRLLLIKSCKAKRIHSVCVNSCCASMDPGFLTSGCLGFPFTLSLLILSYLIYMSIMFSELWCRNFQPMGIDIFLDQYSCFFLPWWLWKAGAYLPCLLQLCVEVGLHRWDP